MQSGICQFARTTVLIAGISAIFAAAPAVAADMAMKAAAPVPFSWTGAYAGVNLGGAWGKSDYSFFPGAGWGLGIPELASGGSASLGMSNVSGGGQFGYNVQSGPMVYGVEADFQYIGLRKTSSFTQTVSANVIVPYVFTETSKADWLATLRGRFSFTTGNVLFYGTGGLAVANSQSAESLSFTTLVPASLFTATGSRSGTQYGWTAGGGVEWALGKQWSVKGEYLYARFPTTTTTMSLLNGFLTQSYSDRLAISLARLGLNYRF